MESLVREILFALRGLGKDRRFTLAAILTLALGIGAMTVGFSVVYNLLFDPYPL